MTITLIIFMSGLLGCGYLGGLLHGYNKGVNETEGRWSDADAVKEQCPMYDPQCSKNHHRFDRLKPYRSDR